MLKPLGIGLVSVLFIALIVLGIGASRLPAIGAGALLFPTRHSNHAKMPASCVERVFAGVDVELRGWHCQSGAKDHEGTIVYLHGVADNRGSSIGAIETFLPLGFDVVAYDSRAHGSSGGDRCTYGYFEKRDLQRVLDQIGDDRVVLIGHSLGAAVRR